MPKLNLTAEGLEQNKILAYLNENASDILVEKINSGTPFEKDGKQLVNKKDLNSFMKFASTEARKGVKAGVCGVLCIDDDVVYGWAMHYFEEDSIEGKLYNQDGTEYTPPVPVKKPTPIPIKPTPPPKPKEPNLFDLIAASEKQEDKPNEATVEQTSVENEPGITDVKGATTEDPTIDEIADSLQSALDERHSETVTPKKQTPQFYIQFTELKESNPDSIVLIRLGDFYQAFDGDAETLADEYDITLTGRDVGLESRVPMVGFPYHAADNYITKIRQRHSVVIVEVNGEIVELNKTSAPVIKDDLDYDDEEIEELTEAEMRQFDGDMQEPSGVPKAILTEEQKSDMKFVLTKEDIVSEPSVLKRLHEILGDALA